MMKKIYIGAFALITALSSNAQTTIDFESTSLNPDSYNNGSDLSGGYLYNGVHFYNFYDTNYFYNTGFAISNMLDDSTSGWGNQYSAITAGGFNSENYAIFYPYGNIDLSSSPRIVESMRITNTTYAALSMKDGDFVGKKFGSMYNANGVLDGTNGEDFLKLNISSLSANGDTLATLEYYLADFRFSDSTQDYIVEDWDLVDLSSLNVIGQGIEFIVFDFESSDIGQFGVNTPTYFAMDDFVFSDGTLLTEELTESLDWSVYPNPANNNISIKGIEGSVSLTSIDGAQVYRSDSTNDFIDLQNFPSGVYVLSIQNQNGLSTKRIVKL